MACPLKQTVTDFYEAHWKKTRREDGNGASVLTPSGRAILIICKTALVDFYRVATRWLPTSSKLVKFVRIVRA
jgi:hypothetical protein